MDERGRTAAGGSLGRDALKLIGAGAALGVDPSRLLRADAVELDVLLRVVSEAHHYAEQRDVALARRIVSELSQALKRGR